MLPVEAFETRKRLLILVTYELCVYKDMHCIANSLCKITLKRKTLLLLLLLLLEVVVVVVVINQLNAQNLVL